MYVGIMISKLYTHTILDITYARKHTQAHPHTRTERERRREMLVSFV